MSGKEVESPPFGNRSSPQGSVAVSIRILLMSEQQEDAHLIHEVLDKVFQHNTLLRVGTRVQFMQEIQETLPDIILSNYSLNHFTALDALHDLRSTNLHVPFILVTEPLSGQAAAECIKSGADDYIPKSDLKRLPGSMLDAIEKHRGQRKREEAEKELRRQRDLHEDFFEMQGRAGIGCAILRWHSNTIVFVNDAFCKISGYSQSEIMSMPSFFKLISPDRVYSLELFMRKRITQNRQAETIETVLARKGGGHVEVKMSVWQSSIEQEHRHVVIVRDISEQKHLEQELQNVKTALRERDEHFRFLFDGVRDYAMFMIDPVGKVINWNSGAERILGYGASDIIGTNFSCFFTSEDLKKKKPQSNLAVAMESNRFEDEGWWVRRDTSKFWASVIFSPLRDQKREPMAYYVILHDLSEHKRTEDQLRRQGEDLRALARHLQSVREEERFRIARELHDELGQVLTALRMELSILQRRITKTATESNKPVFIEKIISMSHLIETTMQSVRKIVAELRPTVLDEFGLLTAIQWQAQEFENRTGIRCIVSRLQRDIEVTPNQATALFRILQEALTNVARHAGATNVHLGLEEEGGEVVLTIRDNGKGIETRPTSEGKSFGLLGMEERVRVLNGRIEIRGKKGQGTSIVVRVPISLPNREKSP